MRFLILSAVAVVSLVAAAVCAAANSEPVQAWAAAQLYGF